MSRKRIMRVALWCVLPLVLVTAGDRSVIATASSDESNLPNPAHCQGDISPPVKVAIQTGQDQIQPGALVAFNGEITLEADAPQLTLRLEGLGDAAVQGTTVIALGSRTAGEVVPFSVPVLFGSAGEAGLHVLAEVADESGALLFSERSGVYALMRPEGTVVGKGGFLALKRLAVEEDIRTGRIAAADADAARAAAATVEVTLSDAPMQTRVFTPMERELNRLVGAPTDGYTLESVKGPSGSPAADIDVSGTVMWTDENGNTHPAWGCNVDIYDEDLGFDELLTTVVTDVNGNYAAGVPNDDGIGAGDADIYVQVRLENSWIRCEDNGGSQYVITSSTWDETPTGSDLVFSPVATNTGTGPAMSIFQAATWIAGYVAFDANGVALPQVDVQWPNGDDGSFYDGTVKMEQADRWDWDTVHHEFGHYVMDQKNIENNPGGAHNIGDCVVSVRGGDKSEGNRLAWGEGWPTYNGTVGQFEMGMASLNVPRVGDAQYDDLEDGSVSYSMETNSNTGRGEDNEVAVQRLLWDLYDSNNDGRDLISRSDNSIWNAIVGAAGSPHILSQYWVALRSGVSNADDLLMGEIASDHQIGPRLSSPAEGATVSPSSKTFSWNADVGCPSSYSGDSFTLRFYNAATKALVLSTPGLGTTSTSLSDAQLQTLIASSHNIVWAVEGSHTGSPATGPYLGENRAIVVNTPPVADAGPDQPNVECTSYTTTAVQLNGTGSSDPDGDPLTYTWSAPGVTFDNNHSATPIGQFPMGTTVATLTVSDGIEEDTDTVSITVVDTTPPVIVCPADIVVECSSHGGTPADDPQLVPFFAGVSATDVCDSDPDIADDAPAFFDLGETVVTFTATDGSGNSSSCQAKVTVVDTTPPEIDVVLNRDVLWPPNHKMVQIEAEVTVSDICDPNPTFVIASITSNEPDNGIGDGNTVGDIQADIGTDAVLFSLRSERLGGGDGRLYTIIYTASDVSGNSADDTVTVRVPHDASGEAMLTASLLPEAGVPTLGFVILSREGFDAAGVPADRVYLGNTAGVAAPLGSRLVCADGDDLRDLELIYDAGAVSMLRTAATKKEPVGLHYVGPDGVDYLMADAFIVSTPTEIGDCPVAPVKGADMGIVDPGLSVGAAEETGVQEAAGARLPAGAVVEIFTVTGRLVRSISDPFVGARDFAPGWDGRDASGRQAPAGIYFYRVTGDGKTTVKKVMVAR